MDPEDSPTLPTDPELATIVGDADPELLRALIARIAARYLGVGGPSRAPARLLVGQLPDQLAVPLPLPEGSRVIGTLLRGQFGCTIFLDAPLTPEAVHQFFRERLAAAGWTMPSLGQRAPRPGGFLHVTASDGERLLFCHGARGPALWLRADPGLETLTSVQLELMTDARHSPCAPQQRSPGLWPVLPSLAAPPRAEQFAEGGGSSNDLVQTHARLQTELDPAAVAAHYAAQLTEAGWRCTATGAAGPFAWSCWAFQDVDGQDWRGLFTSLARPDRPGEFLVSLRAEWAAGGGGGGGGWATAPSATFRG